MKVRELLFNKDFDLDMKVKVFAGGAWNGNGWQVATFECRKMFDCVADLSDNVLDSNITYMTNGNAGCLIIECDAEIEKIGKLEVSKMLTVSTAHVTESTFEALMSDSTQNEIGLPIYSKSTPDNGENFGLYVYITEDCLDWDHMPGDLKPLIKLSQKTGCSVLCLDSDGPEVKGLPVYDWEG